MAQPKPFRKGAKTISPSNNPAKNDDIVSRWLGKVDTRYGRLIKRIIRLVGKQDVFGLGSVSNALDFSRGQDVTRINQFMVWLRKQERSGAIDILPAVGRKNYWTDPLIVQNFTRGGRIASQETKALVTGTPTGLGVKLPLLGETGHRIGPFLRQPMAAGRIRLIQARTLNGMRGVTVAMNNQIADIIAEGFLEGVGATQMARNINDRVDKIGMTRARLIARTESNQAYNEGALMEFQNASAILGETVLSQWWATLDSKVRASHLRRHGKVFEQADAQILIGEPNCRCSLLPYIPSIEGEADTSKASSFQNAAIVLNFQNEDYWASHDWGRVCECCEAA